MKPRIQPILIPALAAGFAITTAHADPLAVGTRIGVDFGPTAPTNFFNNVNSYPGTIAAGSLIDTSNVVVDGVSFSWDGTRPTAFLNNDADQNQAGQPSVFNTSNLSDWMGLAGPTNDSINTITLTFAGLNDAFTYDLIIGAAFTSNIASTLWQSGTQSATTVCNVVGQSYVNLTGLTTDGMGNLVITGTGTSPRPDIPVVAALHLTAVPEPSAALLGGLGLLALLRRR